MTHPLRYNEVLSLTTRNYQFTEFGSAFQPASTVVLYKCKCSRFFFVVHIPRQSADTTVCCTSDAKNSLGVMPNQKTLSSSFPQLSHVLRGCSGGPKLNLLLENFSRICTQSFITCGIQQSATFLLNLQQRYT
jgi:hypothetical protein